MSPSQTHFQNAKNFQVYNSQFNNIGGNLIINHRDDSDPVSTILWPHVSAGAIFDSAERYAAGKCHPGTRERIIERITRWIADNNTTRRVLWLHGPAGGGKSAVEHTMCEILKQQHPQSYGASFFFRSGDRDRGTATKLFTTLAYQLAIHFPSIRSQINDALSHDPSLLTKSMEIQFLALIGQPILNCQTHLSHSPILVIDGLDECADDEGTDIQRSIITLMGRLIVEHDLPLRVMVASRPEYWIRDAFNTSPLPRITQVISLRDDEDADKDIKAYLINGFEKIRVENQRVMCAVVSPWPEEEIIDHFVYQASGQYIYASTVLRFVGKSSRFINPNKQLEIITSPGPNHAQGFSELDRLYVTILSEYPESDLETLKRVLGGLLVRVNISIITAALGIKLDDVALVLDALSSLINIQKPDQLPEDYLSDLEPILGSLMEGRDMITFCHLSFREFLTDETRSGPFYVDLKAIQLEIARKFFDTIMHCNIDQNYEIGPGRFVNLYHFGYDDSMAHAALDCLYHLNEDTKVTLFSQVAEKLTSFNPDRKSPDSLLSFMRGLEDCQKICNIISSSGKLENALPFARQRAMHALSLCSAFKVTPTLVYLNEYKSGAEDYDLFSINELSNIPGTGDVISTIRQHRHFLRLTSDDSRYICDGEVGDNTLVLKSMNMYAFRNDCSQTGSRLQFEWNTARIFLVHHYLKFILTSDTYNCNSNPITFLTIHFFNSRETSDISTTEYFQNTTNLSILALMTDLALWTRFKKIHRRWDSDDFIASIFRWFNRQLTDEKALELLQNYDELLPQNLTTTMTFVFEHSLLRHLSHLYTKGICAYEWDNEESISLNVLPLPQGFHEEKHGHTSSFNDSLGVGWASVLDELESKETKSAINPLSWYPLLASRLLFTFVAFLYGQIHPEFSTKRDRYEESFPRFTQYLSYAEPTPQNLDAIRAIVYLYPQSTHTQSSSTVTRHWTFVEAPASSWNPSEDFWRSIGEFLQKYDRSVLSLEELDLFMSWLESPDHADITTYIMIKQKHRPQNRRSFAIPFRQA